VVYGRGEEGFPEVDRLVRSGLGEPVGNIASPQEIGKAYLRKIYVTLFVVLSYRCGTG
jgi:hypothetical protein